MTKENAQRTLEIPVPITLEEFKGWENSNEALKNVLNSEQLEKKIQAAYEEMLAEAKGQCLIELEEVFKREEHADFVKHNLAGNFASQYLSAILLGTPIERAETETILNDEWLSEAVTCITYKLYEAVMHAAASKAAMGAICSLFGGNNIRH